jgi:hypothetical protein
MQSIREPEPHHRILHHKLKESFAPIYMTALSVIQGVALADLASLAVSGYKQFTLVQWLLVVVSFGTLVTIWNQYINISMLWNWVPDLRDAFFPFAFGALELLLNHTILLSLSAWLLVLALLASAGAFVTWYGSWRAKEEEENTRLLSLLNRGLGLGIRFTLGLSVLLLLLAALSRVGGLEATDGLQTERGVLALIVVILVGASLGAYIFMGMRVWNQMIAYARTGRMS